MKLSKKTITRILIEITDQELDRIEDIKNKAKQLGFSYEFFVSPNTDILHFLFEADSDRDGYNLHNVYQFIGWLRNEFNVIHEPPEETLHINDKKWWSEAVKQMPEGVLCGLCGNINTFYDDCGWFIYRTADKKDIALCETCFKKLGLNTYER